jgi:hypothetical protein
MCQFRCLKQDLALPLQAPDGGQQREPAALYQLARRLGTQLAIDDAKSHDSTQTKHAVFEQFDLREYARLSGFCPPQTLACVLDEAGVGINVGPEREVFCARDDANFMRPAPFELQVIYSAVKFQVETAHG